MAAARVEGEPVSDAFFRLLGESPFVIGDGAMGTSLMARGLESGDPPEFWNLEHPDRVLDVHREFIAAGARILLTNSFGADSVRLRRSNAEDRAFELNVAAAQVAREAVEGAPRLMAVAGSMGPTGELFAPPGPLTEEEAERAFAEQARGLVAGGVDVLWVETMYDEAELAIAVAVAAATGKPVVATMTFDQGGRTMMGLAPERACRAQRAFDAPPAAFGANCGAGLANNVAAKPRDDDLIDDVHADQRQARQECAGEQVADGNGLGREQALLELGLLVGGGDHVAEQYQNDRGWDDLTQGPGGADRTAGE